MEQIKKRLAVLNITLMELEDERGVLMEHVKEKEGQIKAWKLVIKELTELDKEFCKPVMR